MNVVEFDDTTVVVLFDVSAAALVLLVDVLVSLEVEEVVELVVLFEIVLLSFAEVVLVVSLPPLPYPLPLFPLPFPPFPLPLFDVSVVVGVVEVARVVVFFTSHD